MGRADKDMSQIRQRGNSYQVSVYSGLDPVTGKRVYLSDSTTDLAEAKRIRTRFRAQVDKQRNANTKASLRHTIQEWLKVHDVEPATRKGYELYLRLHVGPALGDVPVAKISPRTLEQFYAELRRCSRRCDGRPFVEHLVDGPHECRTVKHRRPPGRKPPGGYPPHDCVEKGCKVIECQPHTCKPLSNSTILKIHFMISGALSAAVRWAWIADNPAEVAKKPKQPAPEPDPPTTEQAAQIAEAAWAEDDQWGTLVWLVMVTGVRRGELLGLRWSDVDLGGSTLSIRREKSKTRQLRRISLDPATVEVLTEHHGRYVSDMEKLDVESTDDAFLFSYHARRDVPCDPSGVTHRYTRMCAKLGIDSHLHALRHYSATELLTAGVDLRTIAGRLGHAGGGATTLRVYAAWVTESDQRAAKILGSRIQRPRPPTRPDV